MGWTSVTWSRSNLVSASPENAHVQALVAAERGRTRDGIGRRVAQAIRSGELHQGTDAEGLVTLMDALLVGMSVQSRDGVTRTAIDAAVSTLLRVWDANRVVLPA